MKLPKSLNSLLRASVSAARFLGDALCPHLWTDERIVKAGLEIVIWDGEIMFRYPIEQRCRLCRTLLGKGTKYV